ncbi:MAG TPA: DUF1569 domain-containing protein [Terriglobales bacterium]|nr:DUF1569 domain-containing protein [Terriglobales bacterium]
MKTLSNTGEKAELIARLEKIGPSSERRWGKMSAHEMICHLSDGFRMYMGVKRVSSTPVPYPRALARWIALWAPIPWPKGFKSVPELDQQKGGTRPEVFANDVSELRNLMDRFTRQPRDFQFQPHPQLGPMSEKAWMRMAYLHMDHHLRQFGA